SSSLLGVWLASGADELSPSRAVNRFARDVRQMVPPPDSGDSFTPFYCRRSRLSSCALSRSASPASELGVVVSVGLCCSTGAPETSGADGGLIRPVKLLFQPRRYSGSDLRLMSAGVNRAFPASHPNTKSWLVPASRVHEPVFGRLR